MDKWQAQQAFWESFGIPAYDEQATFSKGALPAFPHIKYESFTGSLGQDAVLSVSIYYAGTSLAEVKQKASEIERYIKEREPLLIPMDGGYLWIKIPDGQPFASPLYSGEDNVQRVVLTVEAECLARF